MKPTSHCLICQNSRKDIQKGVYCGLINEKPKFGNICDKIILDEKLIEKIEELSFQGQLIESKKKPVIYNLFFFLLVAILFFLGGLFLTEILYEKGYISTLSYFIMFIGLSILPLSVGPLRKYFSDKKSNSQKRNELINLLKKYGISYDSEVRLTKQNHNILEVNVKVSLNKNGKKIREYENTFDYNNNEKKVDNYQFGGLLTGTDDKQVI